MTTIEYARNRTIAFGAVSIVVAPLRSRASLPPMPAGTADDIQILLIEGGSVHLANVGVLTAGTVILLPAAAQPEISAVEGCTVTVLTAPVPPPSGRPAPSTDPILVSAENPLAKLITGLVSSALPLAEDMTWISRHAVENMLMEAAQLLIADTSRRRRGSRTPEAFTQAIRMIARDSADPELSAEAVARHISLSLRQAERMFQKRDTTISREIRRARVEHALNLLGDSGRESLTVGQVARLVGFSNGSSLARAMQAEGHASPTAIRNEAASPFTRNRSRAATEVA